MAAPRTMTTMEGARGTDSGAMTLSRHILESQRQQPRARGELSVVLLQLAFAGKIFSHALRRSALDGRLGPTGDRNVQGEATKKLDLFGTDTIGEAFARSELVAALVSEEMDEPRQIACGKRASYVLCVDPLDGSSNRDVNGGVATTAPVEPRGRLTLTLPALTHASAIFVVVAGSSKADALRWALSDRPTPGCPASLLRTARTPVVWWADAAELGPRSPP